MTTQLTIHRPPNKCGARKGNTHGATHYLTSNRLPPGCAFITRKITKLKKQLRDSVVRVKGELSLVDEALVDEAAEWQIVAEKAARWLCLSFDDLDVSQRILFSEKIAKAKRERNVCIEKMKLDQPISDPWANAIATEVVQHAHQQPDDEPDDSEVAGGTEDASESDSRVASGGAGAPSPDMDFGAQNDTTDDGIIA